jgi:RHS repeat-associated protein
MVLSETSNGQTSYYWQGLDTLAQGDGTNTKYFAYDGLGSVRQLTDTSGAVQLAQTFDPYGNPYAKAGSAMTGLGFSGEQTDTNGFVFLRARYYNPSAGRFLNTDPSRREQNAYLYGLGNPVNRVDPSGLDPTSIPVVDEVTGRLKDIRNWYQEGTANAQWLTSAQRRDKAVSVALHWATQPPGALPWGNTTSPSDQATCNDCIRFVSYSLWRAGFRMTGVDFNQGDPHFTGQHNPDYWWAAGVAYAGYPGSTDTFGTVDNFVAFWEKAQPGEGGPRATPTDNLLTLQLGDVIIYRWANYESPAGGYWHHAAIVVKPQERSVIPYVATRGASMNDPTNPDPNVRLCGSGIAFTPYNSSGIRGVTGNFTIERVMGLHINY